MVSQMARSHYCWLLVTCSSSIFKKSKTHWLSLKSFCHFCKFYMLPLIILLQNCNKHWRQVHIVHTAGWYTMLTKQTRWNAFGNGKLRFSNVSVHPSGTNLELVVLKWQRGNFRCLCTHITGNTCDFNSKHRCSRIRKSADRITSINYKLPNVPVV